MNSVLGLRRVRERAPSRWGGSGRTLKLLVLWVPVAKPEPRRAGLRSELLFRSVEEGRTVRQHQRPAVEGKRPRQGAQDLPPARSLRHPTPLSGWGLPRGVDNAAPRDEACGHDGESGASPAPGGHACAAVGGTGATSIGGVILTPEPSLHLSDRDEFRVLFFMSLPCSSALKVASSLRSPRTTASGTGSALIPGYQPGGAEPLTFLRAPAIRRDHWREDHPTPAAALLCPTRHCAYRNRRHITANLYERAHQSRPPR